MSLLKETPVKGVYYVDVTISAGQTSGTATVEYGSKIIGNYAISNQDQLIDSIAISGATLTVTLAVAATADNVIRVTYVI